MAKQFSKTEPIDDGLGTFDPSTVAREPTAPYTIPALEDFRDNPTKETHLKACELLHRCGPLALDGVVYKLERGRVVSAVPNRDPRATVPDDPSEVI